MRRIGISTTRSRAVRRTEIRNEAGLTMGMRPGRTAQASMITERTPRCAPYDDPLRSDSCQKCGFAGLVAGRAAGPILLAGEGHCTASAGVPVARRPEIEEAQRYCTRYASEMQVIELQSINNTTAFPGVPPDIQLCSSFLVIHNPSEIQYATV